MKVLITSDAGTCPEDRGWVLGPIELDGAIPRIGEQYVPLLTDLFGEWTDAGNEFDVLRVLHLPPSSPVQAILDLRGPGPHPDDEAPKKAHAEQDDAPEDETERPTRDEALEEANEWLAAHGFTRMTDADMANIFEMDDMSGSGT